MVGPTPVSALIHAATMVTAGVYMIARMNFLYVLSPPAMVTVAAVGAVTSFFAATIAIVQPDIKRVLAYSTISQIGYMMLGVGVGAFAAGIFHLMTHAFFKALLFLCAGSVIHALGGEQDMNRMGGLRRHLPITWLTMLIAGLAISGIPPFSGFFSKDLILDYTYSNGPAWLWILGVITAGLTAFYIFRLLFMTFHGASRIEPEKAHHVHESPPVMAVPMIVLAVFSLIGGWVGLPEGILWGHAFERFLAPIAPTMAPGPGAAIATIGLPYAVASVLPLALAIIGIVLAWVFYLQMPQLPGRMAESLHSLYRLLLDKYYIDQLYNLFISRPLFWMSQFVLFRGIDEGVIDGIANGTGLGVEGSGEGLRRVETGNVQDYAFVYLLGVLAIAAYYLYRAVH
jgi:NADH-quinone oxidoreductase subunit L